jgi:hypothetical protein
MPQIFHRSTNAISRFTVFGSVFGVVGTLWLMGAVERSPWVTQQCVVRDQPVPFSHRHHVGQLGIDCRYCHVSVEESAFAGIPATKTCMTCHSQVWTDSPMLEPVRASWRDDRSIEWTRVHDLPDFAYFNHSIHVAKGIGCESCHGRVDRMPLTWQESSLQMEWCLECHREPERHIRPRDEVYTMGWDPSRSDAPTSQAELGRALVDLYDVHTANLTNCSICHR